jgi:hypothetical protein
MSEFLLNDMETCRICLEDDIISELIYPCKCSGTSKYVHKSCLDQWRTLSNNREAYYKCFECHYKYRLTSNTVEIPDTYIVKFFRYVSNNLLPFLTCNIIIISLLCFLLESIDTSHQLVKIFNNSTDTSEENKIHGEYLIWSSIFYVLFLLIVSLYNFCFIKNKILYLKYYFQNKAWIFTAFIGILVLFFIDIIFTILFLTFVIQLFIKKHFQTLDKIKREKIIDVHNYYEQEDLEEKGIIDEDSINPSDINKLSDE